MKKRKGFTLIELIAVLVILAILALIVTPLIMSIIKKAKDSANKRSIDSYGRSIELAIVSYLLDNGDFPTSIDQLTIEYSGDEVVCSTVSLNSDSTVYLAGCTVGGVSIDGYSYGKEGGYTFDKYKVGDEVSYNNINYYVLSDSSANDSTVILLKAEPLTVAEVNEYGTGHVNRYTTSSVGTAYNSNGYGGMAYYTSETCGYPNGTSGCSVDYNASEIKFVVDAWASAKAPAALDARLISKEEYDAITVVETYETPTEPGIISTPAYDWQYSENYWCWTDTPYNDSNEYVWAVGTDGILSYINVNDENGVVRPVITISKSLISN